MGGPDEEIERLEARLAELQKQRAEKQPWRLSINEEWDEYQFENGTFSLSCFNGRLDLITYRTDDDVTDKIIEKLLRKLAMFPLMEKYIRMMSVTDNAASELLEKLDG